MYIKETALLSTYENLMMQFCFSLIKKWGNGMLYQELREKYKTFTYEGYDIDETLDKVNVRYHFSIEGLAEFAPTWTFPKRMDKNFSGDSKFEQMIFSLGMVELVSYWKISCPKRVVIKDKALTKDQISWWKSLYYNGLGEFYYTNKITENENDFMEIIPENGIADNSLSLEEAADIDALYGMQYASLKKMSEGAKCMVPIGGGKDSVVSLDVLKKYKDNVYAYIINPRKATVDTTKRAGMNEADGKVIAVKRTLDKRMIELNKAGFLNGHTPFSAIVAFSSTIAAYMNDITYIVLSNESSANESTVPGSYVNHQYSKSFQFEKDFHDYEAMYLASGTYYFSLLRPLSEFQIAADFATCTDFYDIFRSCNVGSKEDIWCGHCPKCMFVWLILSPFITQENLKKIFGVNMAEDVTMQETFDKLVGIASEKPFECVGSVDEVNAAITLTIKAMLSQNEKLPYLFDYYVKTGKYEENLAECEKFFKYFDEENLLPVEFMDALVATLKEKLKERAPR